MIFIYYLWLTLLFIKYMNKLNISHKFLNLTVITNYQNGFEVIRFYPSMHKG
jgi:hypothetical protein